MADSTTTSLKLQADIKRVQKLATARRRSAHWLIREAIAEYVERKEQREAAWQSAHAAWEAYVRSGLHVTAEEADAWLARLEAGETVSELNCHG